MHSLSVEQGRKCWYRPSSFTAHSFLSVGLLKLQLKAKTLHEIMLVAHGCNIMNYKRLHVFNEQRSATALSKQSRRPGGSFGGLAPSNKAPSPQNWNIKHYKSVGILSIFTVSSPPTQIQSPPQKRKALLLKTFWRRLFPSMVFQTQCFVLFAVRNTQKVV